LDEPFYAGLGPGGERFDQAAGSLAHQFLSTERAALKDPAEEPEDESR
jgi:hypothetical protein